MPRMTRPTMDDVARLAKVSKPTVSRVLSGSPLVSAETRERVLAVAREQGYAPNRNAQTRTANKKTIERLGSLVRCSRAFPAATPPATAMIAATAPGQN